MGCPAAYKVSYGNRIPTLGRRSGWQDAPWPAFGIAPHQDEIAVVGHQDLVVETPILADLFAIGGDPGVLGGGFDLDYAARGDAGANGFGAVLGELIGGEESAIGIARSAIL